MNNIPLVSICTPCYNHEKYLNDYFMGVINQTYTNIELIIIDDSSTDNSAALIESWLDKLKDRFDRVVFLRNESNLGVVKNVNKLIKESKGKYIKLFASDDIMLDNEIEKKVDFLECNPNYGMCFGNCYVIGEEFHFGNSVADVHKLLNRYSLKNGYALFQQLMKDNVIPSPTVLIRKDIYNQYGLYDETIEFEDYEYWLRISRYIKIGYINAPYVCYRKSEASMTNYWGEDGRKRLVNILSGNKKIIKNYIKYIEYSKRLEYIRHFYIQSLNIAIDYNQKQIAIKIYKIIKKKNIKISYNMKVKFILFIFNLSNIYQTIDIYQ